MCYASPWQVKFFGPHCSIGGPPFRDVHVGGEVSVIDVLRWRMRLSLPCIVLRVAHLVMVVDFEAKRRCSGCLG